MIEQLLTKEDLSKYNSNNIKWKFTFWLGQIGIMLGIVCCF